VGAAFGLGYRTTAARLAVGLALTVGAASLEGLQNFVPGRNPEMIGFLASSAGAWFGLGLAIAADAILRRATK
jgi:VanZ family protein